MTDLSPLVLLDFPTPVVTCDGRAGCQVPAVRRLEMSCGCVRLTCWTHAMTLHAMVSHPVGLRCDTHGAGTVRHQITRAEGLYL